MKEKLAILIADEDRAVVNSVEEMVKRVSPRLVPLAAFNGKDAWLKIEKFKPKIVISSLNLPQMDGIQLLIKLKGHEDTKDIFFLGMLSPGGHNKTKLAHEKGIDEFIKKPIESTELTTRIRTALKLVDTTFDSSEEQELIIQLADELENTINNTVEMGYQAILSRIPQFREMIKNTAQAAVWIAEKYGDFEEEEIKDIQIAAYLAQCGRLFLPDDKIETPVMIHGKATHKIMYRVPVCARDIIAKMERFKDVAEIVYHIYENIDGSGFPDRQQSWQIPFASRVLRVPIDFEMMLYSTSDTPGMVMSKIRAEATRVYDHRIVELMDQYVYAVLKENFSPGERAVQIADLEAGMMLARDIITDKGLKLMSAGATLQPRQIEKIISHDTSDPILGNIYIKKG